MADIKLVIKISEEVYKQIQSKSTEIQAEGLILENAVLNGTPLPEGHGKIVDIGKLNEQEIPAIKKDGVVYVKLSTLQDLIDTAPAIIEADKAESEEISERNMKMWQALFKAESEE